MLMLLGSQVPSDKNAVNARKIRKNRFLSGRWEGREWVSIDSTDALIRLTSN